MGLSIGLAVFSGGYFGAVDSATARGAIWFQCGRISERVHPPVFSEMNSEMRSVSVLRLLDTGGSLNVSPAGVPGVLNAGIAAAFTIFADCVPLHCGGWDVSVQGCSRA